MDYLMNQAGVYLSRQSDVQEAIVLKRSSLKLKIARLGEADRNVPLAMGNLALDLAETGRTQDLVEAQFLVDRALELDDVHRTGDARGELASSYMQQASVAVRRMEAGGAIAEGAEATAERALENARLIREALFGAESAEMSNYWNQLGYFRGKQGKTGEQMDAYRKGYDILKSLSDWDAGQLATLAMGLGATALKQGQHDVALSPLQEAYDLEARAFAHDPANPRLRTACGLLISCHLVRHRAGIEGARDAAIALREKHGFDLVEREARAAQYPLTPPDPET